MFMLVSSQHHTSRCTGFVMELCPFQSVFIVHLIFSGSTCDPGEDKVIVAEYTKPNAFKRAALVYYMPFVMAYNECVIPNLDCLLLLTSFVPLITFIFVLFVCYIVCLF